MEICSKYSRSRASEIILRDVELKSMDEIQLLSKIEGWNKTELSNQDVLDNYLVILFDESRKRPVQDLGTRIGYRLGAKDAITAVGVGVELLQLLDGVLHSIDKDLEVHSHYRLDRSTFKQLYRLHILPPVLEAKDWESNHGGGWDVENKSIVLGKGNHHNYKQAYDAVNKLQAVKFTLDPNVIIGEEGDRKNSARFLRVCSDYLGEEFSFVWRYDKRGRSYSQGWDINLQSDEYGKAMLNMKPEYVNDLNSLKIAIAGHAGKDKLTWQERIDWFNNQEVFDTEEFDEPILGRKALQAFSDTLDGKSTGYWMSTDATCSGTQIMAVLSGCKQTASTCNLIRTGDREDLYQAVTDEMGANVDRKDAKQAIMTALYNSEREPKEIFGKEKLPDFYKAMKKVVPGAMDVLSVINSCWDEDALAHTWTLPDGHVAHIKVKEMVDTKLDVNGMVFPYRYEKVQASDNYRSLAPNVIHSVDGYVAREMVRRAKFDLVHIHDCFCYHPNHMQEVNQLYREVLADIADMDLLASILSEITGKSVQITKDSNDLAKDILASEYALS